MAKHIASKINQLEQLLPEGLLVDSAWMEANGYSRSLRNQYVKHGWLEQPTRSVYRRPRGDLGWEQVVISLQIMLHHSVSVGGRTALELQGYAHYIPKDPQAVYLYADTKLPGWLNKLTGCPRFVIYNRTRFLPKIEGLPPWDLNSCSKALPWLPESLNALPWGQWGWPLVVSAPERAILELLDDVPGTVSFEMADKFMESLVDLRPRRLQQLLTAATSVKVKRLFLFLADRHQPQWLGRIDRENIDLGRGKRVIAKSGKLDKTYQITVPEELYAVR